jgi:quercetin dioxygenase-like cupin family protein
MPQGVTVMRFARRFVIGIAVAGMLATAWVEMASATAGSGTSSELVGNGRGTFEPFKVKRKGVNDWEVEVEATAGLDIATQKITFPPGSHSGWHSHPGPVFISVVKGTITFYDHNCNATVKTAGEGFLDVGDDAHLARNESGVEAVNVVTYFAPPHVASLRIDQPQPATCPL